MKTTTYLVRIDTSQSEIYHDRFEAIERANKLKSQEPNKLYSVICRTVIEEVEWRSNGDFDRLISIISIESKIPVSMILSRSRLEPLPLMRQIAMRVLLDNGHTSQSVARLLGCKGSNVRHLVKKLNDRIETDNKVRGLYVSVKIKFENRE